jgi:hypothetical protein
MGKLRENAGLRLLSIVLAVVFWFVAQGEQTHQATVLAPVEYLLPEDLVLLNDVPPPEQVVIRASGSRAALRSLQEQLRETPARYVVNVEDAEPGRTVHSFRKLPQGVGQDVTVDTISPAEVELAFDEIGNRTLPVLMRTRGKLPAGFVEASRSLDPPEVTLIGAASELADLEFVQTLPIALGSRETSFQGELGLDVGDLHLTVDSPRVVSATLEVAEAVAERELGVVPLTVALPYLRAEPQACLVRLSGPVPILDALREGALQAEMVGDPTRLKLSSEGEGSVPWSQKADEASRPGVRIRIDHPRGAELTVLGVEPPNFAVFRVEPPPESPIEGGDGSETGDGG